MLVMSTETIVKIEDVAMLLTSGRTKRLCVCSAAQLSPNERLGEERHGPLEEVRLGQRRVGDHQPERHQPEKCERHEQHMQGELEAAAGLDQRCLPKRLICSTEKTSAISAIE